MTKIAETGIQYRQIRRWTTRKPECFQDFVDLSGLTIYEFAPHLIILIIGMGISAIILFFETLNTSFGELKGYQPDFE